MSDETRGTYVVDAVCDNCGQPAAIEVARGTTIADGLRFKECGGCGCTALRQAGRPAWRTGRVR